MPADFGSLAYNFWVNLMSDKLKELFDRLSLGVAARIQAVALVSMILGVGAQLFLARSFGSSHAVDNYFASLAIPTFVAGLFGTACSFGVIPILTSSVSNDQRFSAMCKSFLALTFLVALIMLMGLLTVSLQSKAYSERLGMDYSSEAF